MSPASELEPLSGIRILFVDDDDDLRDAVVLSLRRCGAVVSPAANGISALELFNHLEFDVVLSDMRMPDGDGFFLADSIQKSGKRKPLFLIFSGYNDLTPEMCVEAGIAETIEKPTTMDEIVRRIRKHLKL
jgi:CheY-like chemotaxis protein